MNQYRAEGSLCESDAAVVVVGNVELDDNRVLTNARIITFPLLFHSHTQCGSVSIGHESLQLPVPRSRLEAAQDTSRTLRFVSCLAFNKSEWSECNVALHIFI